MSIFEVVDQVQVLFESRAHIKLTCCIEGRVVWSPVTANPRLKEFTEI